MSTASQAAGPKPGHVHSYVVVSLCVQHLVHSVTTREEFDCITVAMQVHLQQLQGGGVGGRPPDAALLQSLRIRVLLLRFIVSSTAQAEYAKHPECAPVLILWKHPRDKFSSACTSARGHTLSSTQQAMVQHPQAVLRP